MVIINAEKLVEFGYKKNGKNVILPIAEKDYAYTIKTKNFCLRFNNYILGESPTQITWKIKDLIKSLAVGGAIVFEQKELAF